MDYNFIKMQDIIARNCAITSNITANTLQSLALGEIRVLNEKGEILATHAAAKKAKAIRFAQGRGTYGDTRFSDLINRKDIDSYEGTKFCQMSERKIAVGFNGVAGSIESIASNNYFMILEHKGNSEYRNAQPYIHDVGYETGSTVETQLAISKGLAEIAALNYAQFGVRVVDVYKLCSSTTEVALTGTGAISFDYGVNSITAATDIDAVLVVGDAIRLATGATKATYTITSMDTTNNIAYLDQIYLGESQVILDSVAKKVAKGTGAGGVENASVNWGIVILGATASPKAGFGAFDMVNFDIVLRNVGTTNLTHVGTGYDIKYPSGRHEQVGISEFYNQGQDPGLLVGREYANDKADVKSGYGYSCIDIIHTTNQKINTTENNGQKKQLSIWIERGTYANILANASATSLGTNLVNGSSAGDWDVNGVGFINVLNAFMGKAEIIENTADTVNLTNNGGESLAGGTKNGADTKYNAGVDL